MKHRHLDNNYFRVMRDGRAINICWTDLDVGDIVEFMDKHNNEAWLIDMIQRMNELTLQYVAIVKRLQEHGGRE